VKAKYFVPASFRKWLEKNHAKKREVLVGFWKKHTKKKSMTWPESVDEALCFGWIDGVRHTVDADRYTIRFTPRKPTSNWSYINLRRIPVLVKERRMRPAGLAAYERRTKSRTYSYETKPRKLPPAYAKKFRKHARAWKWFSTRSPWYRRVATHWVLSAKQEATRERRLAQLIAASKTKSRPGPFRVARAQTSR
jgi:uncharacterized protein YdeI (YjbR/CyaY-like superfamily)